MESIEKKNISANAHYTPLATRLYARDFEVEFNPSKSRVIVINGPPIAHPLSFMGGTIQMTQQERHLGILFGNVQQREVIDSMCTDMIRKTNMIIANFGLLPLEVTYALFKTHCIPLYGCQLLDLDDGSMSRLFVTWRKCIRTILNLPPRTHSNLLHLICNDVVIETQIYLRFVKFFKSVIFSPNEIVFRCAMLALHGSRSSISNSLSLISNVCNTSRLNIAHGNCIFESNTADGDNEAIAVFIQNLLYDRWFTSLFPHSNAFLNRDEITEIITQVCTN
jgi:hypothetical protein